MPYSFYTLDVFTDTKLGGNPLAVLPEADGLSDAAMLAITKEFNLSETVFVFPPDNPAHSAKVRIFTPGGELPFAGHPTVGTAYLLSHLRHGLVDDTADALAVLEEGVGPVRAGVTLKPGGKGHAVFDLPRLPEQLETCPDRDVFAAALGLADGEIGFENHVISGYSAGVPYFFVPVRDLDTIGKIQFNPKPFRDAVSDLHHLAVYAYCRETVSLTHDFHARMFSATMGLHEDPATGSAAAAFAGAIMQFEAPLDGHHAYKLEQGYEMGRPSLIDLELEVVGKALVSGRIGGYAVIVSEGVLHLSAEDIDQL